MRRGISFGAAAGRAGGTRMGLSRAGGCEGAVDLKSGADFGKRTGFLAAGWDKEGLGLSSEENQDGFAGMGVGADMESGAVDLGAEMGMGGVGRAADSRCTSSLTEIGTKSSEDLASGRRERFFLKSESRPVGWAE